MKKGILVSSIIVIIIAIKLTGLDSYLTFENLQRNKLVLRRLVSDNYILAASGYIAAYIIAVAFSLPGAAILTIGGGFLFGVALCAVYVNAGATTGAVLAFLFVRYLAGDFVQRRYADKLIRFNRDISENGHSYLLMLRLIPVFPFFMINIMAGLTKVPLRTFAWTTSVGIIPGSLVYAFAGKQLDTIGSAGDIFSAKIFIAFTLLGLLAIFPAVFNYAKGRMRRARRG